jgi:hypothetical protein
MGLSVSVFEDQEKGSTIICSPLFEFVVPAPGKDMRGLVVVDALALVGLIWLAWWAKGQGTRRREEKRRRSW